MSGVAPVTREVTQAGVAAYADASGDHNPIHVDEAFARGTPFGGTIAHGMLVLALIGEMMHEAFGEQWLASGRLKVRFKAPARPGQALTASAEAPVSAGGDYAVRVTDAAGETLVEGRASLERA
ncbi:MAG TPA: MaoC family dehydratase [Dehalococcoidia bacterium]|jgi:acyl dehydratase|nr:MaoC family dehydratase [Dehalococcoidia bacterium]